MKSNLSFIFNRCLAFYISHIILKKDIMWEQLVSRLNSSKYNKKYFSPQKIIDIFSKAKFSTKNVSSHVLFYIYEQDKTKDKRIFKQYVNLGADLSVNPLSEFGGTIFHKVGVSGDLDTMDFLLKKENKEIKKIIEYARDNSNYTLLESLFMGFGENIANYDIRKQIILKLLDYGIKDIKDNNSISSGSLLSLCHLDKEIIDNLIKKAESPIIWKNKDWQHEESLLIKLTEESFYEDFNKRNILQKFSIKELTSWLLKIISIYGEECKYFKDRVGNPFIFSYLSDPSRRDESFTEIINNIELFQNYGFPLSPSLCNNDNENLWHILFCENNIDIKYLEKFLDYFCLKDDRYIKILKNKNINYKTPKDMLAHRSRQDISEFNHNIKNFYKKLNAKIEYFILNNKLKNEVSNDKDIVDKKFDKNNEVVNSFQKSNKYKRKM